jgi:pimeloyl-ACP methyl ester carboxylesterase
VRAILLYSPGGFDATVEKWTTLGTYKELKLLDHLPRQYTCIAFDRRETGRSSGRVEPIGWPDYAKQGKGLLDHLGIESAHLMGGCMGCSVAIAFAVAYPAATRSMILFWPVGGAKYRMTGQQRFAEHLAYVAQNGLPAVVALAQQSDKSFGADPRGGPWV